MQSIPERSNLPPLQRSHRRRPAPREIEPSENQEIEPSSPTIHRSSKTKRHVRNSGEMKPHHHHHYPGSTPLNDKFDIQNPSNPSVIELTNENGKKEFRGLLTIPKSQRRPQGWRRLLQKRPKNNFCLSNAIDLQSDDLDEMIRNNGDMVFSSGSEEKKTTDSNLEAERKKQVEQKQKDEETTKLQQSRENAIKEIEKKRAKEAEEESQREIEEERKLRESQFQMLRERAIIDEGPPGERVVENIQAKLQKSKNKR